MSNASPEALVYIVYARADLARVEPIVTALQEHGARVAFDAARAHGGGEYVHESQQALRRARALVVFYSQAAARSPWVEAETRAFQSLVARGGRTLVSVRLDPTPTPLALASSVAVDGADTAPGTVADAIAHALGLASAEREASAPAATIEIVEQARGVPGFGSLGFGSAPPYPAQSKGGDDWPASGAPVAPAAPTPPAVSPAPAEPPSGSSSGPDLPQFTPPPPPSPQPITQPRGGPAPTAPRPRRDTGAPSPQQVSLEQVTFTAYHPREMQPEQWQPLVIYLSLNDPATLALVAASAADQLAGKLDQFRPARSEKAAGLARGAPLRIIPSAPGFQFNPSYLDITWQENVQQHEFRMRAESAQQGRAVNGAVRFYQGMLLRAEVPISVFVGQAIAQLDSPDAYAQAIARAYRRIFASYSHQDMPVVESCENVARTVGDQYLRDVSLLQSGQQWDPRLIQAINDADIFQLFWSKRAATSPFVAREWRHALMLLPARPNFIRPVYWTRQLYSTPPELNALHFQQLSLSSLGWGPLRTAFYEWRNG